MNCSVGDCGRKYYAKTFCKVHYQRHRQGKILDKYVQVRGDNIGRFFSHIDMIDECWVWGGARKGKGYGSIHDKSKSGVQAHRFAYKLFIGPIPKKLQIDHLCENKLCVNPDHLEPVTNKENQYRAFRNRGHWPIEGRKKKEIICIQCGKKTMSIMYERMKYCSNACRCKAKRQRQSLS